MKRLYNEFKDCLTRRKPYYSEQQSDLAKVLNIFDLTALGVGSTLGVGVYVLAGVVAKDTSGPGVVLAFFIAAAASALAGLCYAELGARVPTAGSAYVYSYVCIGEFLAFITGWNLILNYLIGSATTAKALVAYVDELTDGVLVETVNNALHIKNKEIDIIAFILINFLGVVLVMGVKESTMMNNIFSVVNVSVIIVVICAGCTKINLKNWSIPKEEVPEGFGDGGFLPYGIQGVLRGTAKCFFGYVGFDIIATTGEEAISPMKTIPLSILLTLLVVFVLYSGISGVITLMLPYYKQHSYTPLSYVFKYHKMPFFEYCVGGGAICGLCSSMFGALFPLPRIVYAMADDGILMRFLAKVHDRFKTPYIAVLVCSIITSLSACFSDLIMLIDLMSIGTLFSYAMVSLSIILLRFEVPEDAPPNPDLDNIKVTFSNCVKQLFKRNIKEPNKLTEVAMTWMMVAFFVIGILLMGLIWAFEDDFYSGCIIIVTICGILFLILMVILGLLACQPYSTHPEAFSVPYPPWIPGLSILVNIYLMINISTETWIVFSYFMIVGFIIYFGYGMWNSSESSKYKNNSSA